MNVKIEWKKLAVSLAAPLAVGGLAALITKDNMLMFEVIEKPPLAPPGWLFPVSWTMLYILMGLASYSVWISDARKVQKQTAGVYYALSLIFNFGWPIIFFNSGKYLAAPDVDIHSLGNCPVLEMRQCGRMADAAVSPVDDFLRISEHGNLFA